MSAHDPISSALHESQRQRQISAEHLIQIGRDGRWRPSSAGNALQRIAVFSWNMRVLGKAFLSGFTFTSGQTYPCASEQFVRIEYGAPMMKTPLFSVIPKPNIHAGIIYIMYTEHENEQIRPNVQHDAVRPTTEITKIAHILMENYWFWKMIIDFCPRNTLENARKK